MARLVDRQGTLPVLLDLVVKAREQHQLFIQMLSGLTNISVNSLKCMLCQDDIADVEEREKDGIMYVSFRGKEIPKSRQSLEKLTDNISRVIAFLKECEPNTTTSSTSNVKNILKNSQRRIQALSSIRKRLNNPVRDLDESPLHDSENNTIFKRAQAVVTDDNEKTHLDHKSPNGGIQDAVFDDAHYKGSADPPSDTAENEITANGKELDEFLGSKQYSASSQNEPFQTERQSNSSSNSASFPHEEDDWIVPSMDSSGNETGKNVDIKYDSEEPFENEQSDSFQNESKSNLRSSVSPTLSIDDRSSSDESGTFGYSFDGIKDAAEPVDPSSATSENEIAANGKELDEFLGSKEYSASSQNEPFQTERQSNSSSNAATFPPEEDNCILPSMDSSENETGKNVDIIYPSEEPFENEQSDSFQNESKSNLRSSVSPTLSNDDRSSSDESGTFGYSFDGIKDAAEPVDPSSATSENEIAANGKELDEFLGSKEYSAPSQNEPLRNEHVNKSSSSNSATFPREEDEWIVSSTDSSENETGENSDIQYDSDESFENEQSDSFQNESKSNLSSSVSPTLSNDDRSSSDESITFAFTFDETKDDVVTQWKKLKKRYNEELSISRRKFDVAYIDSNGDFKLLHNNSVSEAKLRAFNLKDISRVSFPVVLIVLDDESLECTTSRKKSKVSLSEVGPKDWPTICGSLHCALDDEHCGFSMNFNLDTGADSGSVGYKYDIVKNFILTVDNVNGDLEPAVLCKVSIHSVMGEEVQVFDIDEDRKWNAIGLATLKKFKVFIDIENHRVVMEQHKDVVVSETEETVEVKFHKNVVSGASPSV